MKIEKDRGEVKKGGKLASKRGRERGVGEWGKEREENEEG